MKAKGSGSAIKRRSFLKLAGFSSVGLSLGFPFFARWGKVNATEPQITQSKTVWRTDPNDNKYFIPKNIRTEKVNDQGQITAKVDGWWQTYPIREFDDEFHQWWIDEKSWYYDQLIAFFEGESDVLNIPNGGHHHPTLTTYGKKFGRRGDSDFHLNNAVKGFTIIPKEENIEYINEQIQAAYNEPGIPIPVFKKRKELYQQKDLWDKTRFATLELYTGRPINAQDPQGDFGFNETKTFQNINANPMSVLTYVSLYSTDGTQSYFGGQAELIPEFGFKGFCWLISHYNPDNTDYEMKIANYINQAHCLYHGGACDIATNIFLVVEQFNETPSYDPGRGKKTVPAGYPYSTSSANMTVKSQVNVKKKLTRDEKMELIRKLHLPV